MAGDFGRVLLRIRRCRLDHCRHTAGHRNTRRPFLYQDSVAPGGYSVDVLCRSLESSAGELDCQTIDFNICHKLFLLEFRAIFALINTPNLMMFNCIVIENHCYNC